MFVVGQKRKGSGCAQHFRFTPISVHQSGHRFCQLCAKSGCEQSQQHSPLFDHLVGAGEQRRRQVDVERPGGFEIDDEFQPSGLLNGEITGLLAL
jgi:hypothetical protein